jgi:hypothetical protein
MATKARAVKADQNVYIPSPMTAQSLVEFCTQHGGAKGEHEVFFSVEDGTVLLCLVKRVTGREVAPGHPNGKVWATRVIPQLPEQGE